MFQGFLKTLVIATGIPRKAAGFTYYLIYIPMYLAVVLLFFFLGGMIFSLFLKGRMYLLNGCSQEPTLQVVESFEITHCLEMIYYVT